MIVKLQCVMATNGRSVIVCIEDFNISSQPSNGDHSIFDTLALYLFHSISST
jgi:Ser-tRNA(Ala) deacylase AlaX